jgi:hypothetical protein
MSIRKALDQMNEEFGNSANSGSPSLNFGGTPSFGDRAGADVYGQFNYYAGLGDDPPVFEYPSRYTSQLRNRRSTNMRQALQRVAGVEEEMPQMGGGMQGMLQQMMGGMGGMGGQQGKRPFVDTPGQTPAEMDFEMAKKMTGFVDDMKTPETLPGRPQEVSQQAGMAQQTQMNRPAGHEEIPQSQLVPKYIAGKGRVQVHPEDIRMHYTRRAAVSAIERNNAAIKNLIQFGGGNQDDLILKMVDDNYDLLKHAVGLEDKEPIPTKIRQQLMQGQIPSDDDDEMPMGDSNAAIADMGMFEETMATASFAPVLKKRGGANFSGGGGGGASYLNPFMYAPSPPSVTTKTKRKRKRGDGFGTPLVEPPTGIADPVTDLTPTAPVEDEPEIVGPPPPPPPTPRGPYAAQNTATTYGGFSRDKPGNWWDSQAIRDFYNALVEDFGQEVADEIFNALGIPIPQG